MYVIHDHACVYMHQSVSPRVVSTINFRSDVYKQEFRIMVIAIAVADVMAMGQCHGHQEIAIVHGCKKLLAHGLLLQGAVSEEGLNHKLIAIEVEPGQQ